VWPQSAYMSSACLDAGTWCVSKQSIMLDDGSCASRRFVEALPRATNARWTLMETRGFAFARVNRVACRCCADKRHCRRHRSCDGPVSIHCAMSVTRILRESHARPTVATRVNGALQCAQTRKRHALLPLDVNVFCPFLPCYRAAMLPRRTMPCAQ
jgi:hypothetical protein